MNQSNNVADKIELHRAKSPEELPEWANVNTLAEFLNVKMQPYHDELYDVHRGLDYAFGKEDGKGGFVVVAGLNDRLVGAIVMLETGMKGYIPENLLLFVAVEPELRGNGIGRKLIEAAAQRCEGNIKLHVEPDNPAKRLYERVGFQNKYLEMRWTRK